MSGFLITKSRRKKIREFARQCWIDADGDFELAKKLAAERLSDSGVGSLLTLIIISSAVLQICYTLFRFWRDARCKIPPAIPDAREPS